MPDTFSVAVKDDIVVVGLVDQGAWLTSDLTNWHPFFPCIITSPLS
jgi:hypothetical protein